MRSKFFSLKSLYCMAIALSALVLLGGVFSSANAANGIITTVAGNGTWGFSGDGGPATSAQLNYPYGVAVDSIGNLYIADDYNHRIRKVSTNGIITTVAGSGVLNANGWIEGGFSRDGGPATSAQLSYPSDVASDTIGNLYIVDSSNSRVRKITFPTKIINLSPSSLAFGNVTLGSSATKTLIISNTGDSLLTVTSISYSYPADFSGNWSGTIPAGGSQNVTVTFSPTAVFSYNGTLTVNSDRTSGTNTVAISGTGITASSAILTIDDVTAIQGTTNAAVRVSLNNPGVAVSSMQFDILYNATIGIHANGSYTLSSRTPGFTMSVTPSENGANSKATVLIYKLSGSIATGTGAIVDILFNADSSATVGTSTLSLNNCVLSDISANRIASDCTDTAIFKVEPACGSPGDINKDGAINVLDLQLLINCIMGRGSCNCCDLNSDSSYNIFDLQLLINKIIAAVSTRSERDNGNNTLTLPVIQTTKNGSGSFGIGLNNESAVASGEFVFTYDSTTGFDITDVRLTSRTGNFSTDMTTDTADPKNVKIKVLLYSMGKTVTPGTGNILAFTYTTSANAAGNTGLTFAAGKNFLSDSSAQAVNLTTQNGSVTISDAIAGNVNGIGGVDLADAITALQIVAGLNPPNVNVGAIVNNDSKIGLEEVIYILQKVAGVR